MMAGDFGWVAIASIVVAIATLALGGATVWLGWQTRQARVEAHSTDERRILRAALAEQLNNCRMWVTHDPARGQPSFEWLRGAAPRLHSLQAMIQELELQADLVPYLVWLIGTLDELWTQIDRTLNWPVGPDGILTVNEERLPDEWRVMVERLQVAAALVAGEARRRGFDDLAAPHELSPWVIPRAWEERGRELMSTNDIPFRGAPPFPADPAFARAAPAARDEAGAETAERQQAFLLDQSDRVRRVLRRR
jgi:hypothetical protein